MVSSSDGVQTENHPFLGLVRKATERFGPVLRWAERFKREQVQRDLEMARYIRQ